MELAYTRSGKGDPVVLIHGIGHMRSAWSAVAKLLAKNFDVISVDLPGFGDSPTFDGDGPLTTDDFKAAVVEQYATWGIERPHIVGNSLGGLLGLELAADGHAASVTAINPAGFNNRVDKVLPWLALRGNWVASHYVPRFVYSALARLPLSRGLILATFYTRSKKLKAKERATYAIAFGRSPGFNRTLPLTTRHRFAGAITVPTTVVWGSKDRVYRHGLSKRAAKRLPNGQHITLGGAGHIAHGDAPDQVAEIIAQTARRTRG